MLLNSFSVDSSCFASAGACAPIIVGSIGTTDGKSGVGYARCAFFVKFTRKNSGVPVFGIRHSTDSEVELGETLENLLINWALTGS